MLAHAVEPDVPWHDAATMMVDDFRLRALQTLVEWLDAICELMQERIRRMSETPVAQCLTRRGRCALRRPRRRS